MQLLVPSGLAGVAFTSRPGGSSLGPYEGLNLATHTGDDPVFVRANRRKVADALGIGSEWVVLKQMHGCRAVLASDTGAANSTEADAVVADLPGVPVAVMAADCLPIAMIGKTKRAVAHAGWRGLCSGVIEAVVAATGERRPEAWIGPSIGPCHFEVGPEVVEKFKEAYPQAPAFWTNTGRTNTGRTNTGRREAGERLMFDLRAAARWILRSAGATVDEDDPPCTMCESRYYSFRRDGVTGRQAVLVWR